jgi:hypothetical protein
MPETKLTTDELKAMNEARRASQDMVKRVSQTGANHVPVDKLVLDEENKRVVITVPHSFFLTLDDHRRVHIPAGIVSVPEKLADHWYVKNHGCKSFAGASASPAQASAGLAYLGSEELPGVVRIGGTRRLVYDFVVAAAHASKLSIADWNALSDDERRDRIVVQLEAAARADREEADKARSQIKQEPVEAAKATIDKAAAPDAPPSPADGAKTEGEQTGTEAGTDADKAS